MVARSAAQHAAPHAGGVPGCHGRGATAGRHRDATVETVFRPPADASPTWRLPRSLRAEVERRRRLLLEYAGGPAIELSELEGGTRRIAADTLPAGTDVVGVATLAASAEPAALLALAAQALGPGGRLMLFEPYRRPRWSGMLADLAAPALRKLTRLQVNLPVPALVRQAGFVIATIERVSMPTPIAPLRSFCLIVAYPTGAVQPAAASAGQATT